MLVIKSWLKKLNNLSWQIENKFIYKLFNLKIYINEPVENRGSKEFL